MLLLFSCLLEHLLMFLQEYSLLMVLLYLSYQELVLLFLGEVLDKEILCKISGCINIIYVQCLFNL